jgi:hypothetical protein
MSELLALLADLTGQALDALDTDSPATAREHLTVMSHTLSQIL